MYRISGLSSKFFTAFAWCDFILSIMRTEFLLYHFFSKVKVPLLYY